MSKNGTAIELNAGYACHRMDCPSAPLLILQATKLGDKTGMMPPPLEFNACFSTIQAVLTVMLLLARPAMEKSSAFSPLMRVVYTSAFPLGLSR